MKKYHYPTIKERNQAIRNYIDSLVGKARRNEKSKLLLKGVSNSIWTIAKRNGYIINISRGVFDPTIEFTDEIINYLYAEANKYVNYMPESVLQNIQAEIWSSTPVPDVSVEESKTEIKVTAEVLLAVVKYCRANIDTIVDGMLAHLQDQLEEQFKLQ